MRSLVIAWALAGCGTTTATVPATSSETPATAEPPSVLADERVPPPRAPDDVRLDAPGALVFQGAHRRTITDIAFTPDGGQIAAVSAEGVVSLVDVAGGVVRMSRRAFIRTGNRTVFAERSGAGLLVASSSGFRGEGGLLRLDLRSGQWRTRLSRSLVFLGVTFDVHPDDRTVAWVRPESDAPMLVLDDGEERREAVLSITNPGVLRFSPSGGSLIVWDREAKTAVLIGLEELDELARWENEALLPRPRPGGGAIAVGHADGRIVLRAPADGRELRTLATGTPLTDVQWSVDGNALVGWHEDGTAHAYDGRSAQPLGTIAFDGQPPTITAIGKDGILYGGRETLLMRRRLNGEALSPIEVGRPIFDLLPSPRGDGIAVVSGADLLFVGDEGTQWTLPGERGEHSVWGVRWAPDGRSLVTWGRGGVEVWGAGGTESSGCGGTGDLVFSPGGGLYAQGDYVCRLRGGTRHPVGTVVATSADHAFLLTDEEGRLTRRNTETLEPDGSPLRIGDRTPCRYGSCRALYALDADGSHALVATTETHLFDARRGRRIARVRQRRGEGSISSVSLAPDAGAFVTIRRDAEDRQASIALVHRARGGRTTLRHELGAGAHRVAWAPDGRVALASAREVVVVDPRTGNVESTSAGLEELDDMLFTRDGDGLVVRSRSHLRVIDRGGSTRIERDLAIGFAVDDAATITAHCEDGVLVLRELLTDVRRERGGCDPTDELRFAPAGVGKLAQRRGTVTFVHRLGSPETLTLRTYRIARTQSIPTAHDVRGRFQVADEHRALFRQRAPGPLASAPLVAADLNVPDLVATFFGTP